MTPDDLDRPTLPADILALASSWAEPVPEPDVGSQTLNDPWHTTIHEAGHAVVGRKLGLDMGQASIAADDESAGHSLVGDPWATLDRWWTPGRPCREFRSVVRARVIMLAAGAETEREIIGHLQDVEGDHRDGEDRREIARVMESHPGEPSGDDARTARLRRFARALVRRHRADVEAVAAELRERGTVSGPELDEMAPGPAEGPIDPLLQALLDVEPEGEIKRVSITRR